MSSIHDAFRSLEMDTTPGVRCTISHYLYFRKKRKGDEAAVKFRAGNYRTIERLGADGINWLVLVQHEIEATDKAIEDAVKEVSARARKASAEYDGWEISE